MAHILQIVGIVIIWWVLIALFIVLNLYLGSLVLTWYRKRKSGRKGADGE